MTANGPSPARLTARSSILGQYVSVPFGGRLYRALTPLMSLRVIVIVTALSMVALVITLGAWVWFGVTNDRYSQLDRRLDSVSSLGSISTLLRTAPEGEIDMDVPDGGLVRTARIDGETVSVPRDIVLPRFDNGYANTSIDGVEYRVRTFSAGDASIAIGAPLAETQRRIGDEQQHTRAALESARDFAAVASHELRTPLTAMRTNLEVLLLRLPGPS